MSLFPVVNGRANLDEAPGADTDRYMGGIRYTQDGAMCITYEAGTFFNQGIPMSDIGQVSVVNATAGLPADVIWLNGLPISQNRVCVSTNPVFIVSQGTPFDAAGAVAATITPFIAYLLQEDSSFLLQEDGSKIYA
jgi:hypothetical protein